ncbi:Flavonol synthase/flavanone 3-hydroxylase [Vigna angularis]|uniref:Flavonol synthase/flavanone 3-hydroxylase n=1 Tax=Phaseolus angularis TaxID=3914 RepID=A0A8T0L3H3_PHAAN|nr:Flavonol synthase/flavanone 3-hydroxylase [Vigna angularis]
MLCSLEGDILFTEIGEQGMEGKVVLVADEEHKVDGQRMMKKEMVDEELEAAKLEKRKKTETEQPDMTTVKRVNLESVGKEFFELPQEEKELIAKSAGSDSLEGYGTKLQKETNDKFSMIDVLRDSISIMTSFTSGICAL